MLFRSLKETTLIQVCKSAAYTIGLTAISAEIVEFRSRSASESEPSLQRERIWDCLVDGVLGFWRLRVRELQ